MHTTTRAIASLTWQGVELALRDGRLTLAVLTLTAEDARGPG